MPPQKRRNTRVKHCPVETKFYSHGWVALLSPQMKILFNFRPCRRQIAAVNGPLSICLCTPFYYPITLRVCLMQFLLKIYFWCRNMGAERSPVEVETKFHSYRKMPGCAVVSPKWKFSSNSGLVAG